MRRLAVLVSMLAAALIGVKNIPSDEGNQALQIPEKYRHLKNQFWNDPEAIASGEKIYREKCSVCHGDKGDGRGPVAVTSPVKPADFTDKNMVDTMGDAYWFWRVARGGAFPPFNSIMPPFEEVLTEKEIWQAISYEHTFSHKGLHVHGDVEKPAPHRHHDDEG